MQITKNLKYYIFYFILSLIAYWQIGFFINTLKWDMLDVYLPWRSFVSESLLNGHFPLWNPYQNFGYPIHADMRSIWSPEIWLVSLFGGYSVYTFSWLFIIYTSIAGIGMKLFSNLFLKNDKSAFFTGAVYMLSGYLTSHAQEIYTINSFAFVPIVLYNYFKFYNSACIKRGIYFILSIFILLTSAYQAHSVIMLYYLMALFVFFTVKLFKEGQINYLKKFVLYHAAFLFAVLIILLPVIVSAYQVLPLVSRFNSGVALTSISFYSFSPQSLLSLIIPFSVIRDIDFFNTDLSMTNLYFGIIPLIFLIVFFLKKKQNASFNLVLIFGIISLLASFGDYTPLRKILFDYVPLMNLFRGSAYFRLFALIAFSIASGFIILKIRDYKKIILITSFLVLSVVLIFTIYGFFNINFNEFSFISSKYSFIEILSKESSFYENLFIQGVIQLTFILIFIFIVLKNRANYKNTVLLVVINLIIAIQLNIYSTAVTKYSPQNVNNFVKRLPVGFPIPEKHLVSECTDKSISKPPLWRNTSMLAKRVSGDSFNSFSLDKTSFFKDSLTNLKDSITANQLLYFSNNIKPLSEINNATFNKSTLFIKDSIYELYKHISDTSELTKSNYEITKYEPNRIEVIVNAKEQIFLSLIQTNYAGWKVYVDNKPVEIIESNTVFISIFLSKGKHEIQYVYENSILIKAFLISAIVLFILIIIASCFLYNDSKVPHKRYILYSVFILSTLTIFYKQYEYKNRDVKFSEVLLEIADDRYKYIVDKSVDLDTKNRYSIDFTNKHNITKLYKFLEKNNNDTLLFAINNRQMQPEFTALFQNYFNKKKVFIDIGHSKIIKYYKQNEKQPCFYNDFEQIHDEKNYNIGFNAQSSDKNIYFDCKNEEYIQSFTCTLTRKDRSKKIIAIAEILLNQELINDKVLFVFTIEKDDNIIYWDANDFSDFYNNTEKENIFIKILDLNEINYPNKSRLKIFIWNRDKTDFKIDNYQIYME